MSISPQNLLTNSRPRLIFYFTNTHFSNPTSYLPLSSKPVNTFLHCQTQDTHILKFQNSKPNINPRWSLRAFRQGGTTTRQSHASDEFSFDVFLSATELLCLASSAVISIGLAVNSMFPGSQKPVFGWLGNKIVVWQCVLLIGGVVVGSVIRRRQWTRMCLDFSKPEGSGVNLLGRIEKLEEDLRSSVTIVRVLSRQLEKLGIRFRVTRKALKEPIAETAALAQKNSEATRALAAQENMLEKELAEIQNVLLAMQEQQQKQLELILAIGKTGKFWDSKKESSQGSDLTEASNSAVDGTPQMETSEIQALARQKEANIDRA